MGQEEFENLLRESAFFRHMMVELLKSVEQSLAIATQAVSRQIDAVSLGADLLDLQRCAAHEQSDPTRDHVLNAIRERLNPRGAD